MATEEEIHGAEGRVKIENPVQHLEDIDKRIWGEAPVQVELSEDGTHRNILAKDVELMLSVRDDKVVLNLDMDGVEDVSLDDWQERNYSGDEE